MGKKKIFLATLDGARAYLEFLRNLTPQILLLAFAVFASRKLNVNKIDLTNIKQSIGYVFFISMFLMAFSYNCWQFLSNLNAHNSFRFESHKGGFFARFKETPIKYLMTYFEIILCYFYWYLQAQYKE